MKKAIIYLISIISIFNIVIFSGCSSSNFKPNNFNCVGTWWWDDSLGSQYLKFAKKNNVTEIYYAATTFDEQTANFIKKANKYNIKVYYLTGDTNWLINPDSLYNEIALYQEFQNQHPENKFEGIHLNLEPHKNSNFETNEIGVLTALVSLANILSETYPTILFDYDIPVGLIREITISTATAGQSTLPACAHLINTANRVFVITNADSATEIYNSTKNELEYAKSINKSIVVGIETSDIGNELSFYDEGKTFMNNELAQLETKIPLGCGISFNHIGSWKKLSK